MFHIFGHLVVIENSIFMEINCLNLSKMFCTTKISSNEICKPSLSYQRKCLIPAECLKNFFSLTFHSFIHLFISRSFLDCTNASKDVIYLNVKDVESKEEETKNVRNMQTLSFYFL